MNKTGLTILSAMLIGTLVYFSSGCKKEDSPQVTEFTIKVDSTHHADTISVGDAFQIDFYGKVGDNDCYEFFEVEHAFDVNLIEVRLKGKHTERDNCVDGLVYLNPAEISFNGIPEGTYTLQVNQPEGQAPMESEFVVK